VDERFVGNVALDMTAVQINIYVSPARNAVDGQVNTGSCTNKNDPNPWWAVDLGQAYHVAYVTVTMPVFGGTYRNYPLFVHLFIRYNDYRICKTQSVF